MTIDEAIVHALEVAAAADCKDSLGETCANQHRQLAEWLKELKELRKRSWQDARKTKPPVGKSVVVQYTDAEGIRTAHTSFINSLNQWFGVPRAYWNTLQWCYQPQDTI